MKCTFVTIITERQIDIAMNPKLICLCRLIITKAHFLTQPQVNCSHNIRNDNVTNCRNLILTSCIILVFRIFDTCLKISMGHK